MKCKAFKSVFRNRWVWIIREHGHTLFMLWYVHVMNLICAVIGQCLHGNKLVPNVYSSVYQDEELFVKRCLNFLNMSWCFQNFFQSFSTSLHRRKAKPEVSSCTLADDQKSKMAARCN